MALEKIGITYHPKSEAARLLAEDTRKRLEPRGAGVWVASAWDEGAREQHIPGTRLIICFGGDGTVLRAARAVVPHAVTLLGVNLGRIGFLTEITPQALTERLDEIASGIGRIETRAMLEMETRRADGSVAERLDALNDVVVGRAAIGRTVQFAVSVDGTIVGGYRADGVIVATATGSTAYSLSVGGPILHPESRAIIVTPVAPHLSPANSLVLSDGATVEVAIAPNQSGIVSVDGQPESQLGGGDVVCVRPSEHSARFLRLGPAADFYTRIGRRLNWLSE